ncbi:helix-turn-helix domain-containing protein [Actinoallomurus iriomotensis]|uniref:helix-turn-helix domain-containing protein n=1 Tax=Actinoallomurus iriomotensis TaxID=478107 RepID=UPI0025579DC8|nr:helix-turn-helix domain-containing protein [Actinoallomurus iriomotensis]
MQEIDRTAKDPVKLRRMIVVLMPAQGWSVPDIAHLLDCSTEYVRGVIHDFNDVGFKELDPKWSRGRPKTISEAVRRPGCSPARCGRLKARTACAGRRRSRQRPSAGAAGTASRI